MWSGEREALRRHLRDVEATAGSLERQVAERNAQVLRLEEALSRLEEALNDTRAERNRAVQALASEIDKRRYFGVPYFSRRVLARVRSRDPQRTENA
jgi:septal ring factor EnvC (AmiA/AmiB activator)